MELIAKARAKTMEDPSAKDLLAAELTVLEAEESLRRQAWPILIAQTSEMASLINGVKSRATPRVEPAEEPEAPAETTTPEPTPDPEPAADETSEDAPAPADDEAGDAPTTEDDEDADEPSE